MTAPKRDYQVTYGSLTVGSAARPMDGPMAMERTETEFRIEFSWLSRADTPSAFATEIAAVEDALRIPNQNLQVVMGDGSVNATYYDLQHALATGFDARPEILLRSDKKDSALHRFYRARVTVGIPANKLPDASVGRMGRRESRVSVDRAPSGRRTLTLNGTWTGVPAADGSPLARTQYEAKVDAYAAAVRLSVDPAASWELVGEPVAEIDDTVDTSSGVGRGHVLRFQRTYRELIFHQAGASVLDDAEIIEQQLVISRRRTFPTDAITTRRLDFVEAQYSCALDKSNLNPKAKWEGTIRQFVLTELEKFFDGRVIAITDERVEVNLDENLISATLTTEGVAGQLIHQEVTVEDRLETGKVAASVWSGNPHAKYEYQGPARRLRTIEKTVRLRVQVTGDPLARGIPFQPVDGHIVSWTKRHTPIRFGAQENAQNFLVTDINERIEILYFLVGGAAGQPGEPLESAPGFTGLEPEPIGL